MTSFPSQIMVNLVSLLGCFIPGPHKRGILSKHTANDIYNRLQALRIETLVSTCVGKCPQFSFFATVEATARGYQGHRGQHLASRRHSYQDTTVFPLVTLYLRPLLPAVISSTRTGNPNIDFFNPHICSYCNICTCLFSLQ